MADKTLKYYRSQISGLSVEVGSPEGNNIAPEMVRFVPFREKVEGDLVKVGYLATDNAVAHRKLKNDPNVEEVDKQEYEHATNPDVNPKVKQLPY